MHEATVTEDDSPIAKLSKRYSKHTIPALRRCVELGIEDPLLGKSSRFWIGL